MENKTVSVAKKRKASKGCSAIFGLVLTVIVCIGFFTCLFSSKSTPTPSAQQSAEDIQIHFQAGVRVYLKDNLKDWDSYEDISWGTLQKSSLASDIIEVAKLTKNVIPKTGAGKNSPNDEGGKINKDDYDKIYVLEKSNGWVKIRTQPNDEAYMKSNGLYYWSGWVPETSIEQIAVDNSAPYSIRHKYRAKNIFGAYEVSDELFYLNDNADVVRVVNMGE